MVTGGTGADDFEFGGDGAGLGGPLVFPATLNGGAGDDTLRGGALGDTFSGGAGEDVVTYDDRLSSVNASLNGLADDGAVLEGDLIGTDVEDITGGSTDDNLTGDLRANTIDGGPGNDIVSGGRGDDTLTGGAGNDVVAAGAGDDTLDETAPADGTDALSGGDGSDTVDYSGRTGAVMVTLDGRTTAVRPARPTPSERTWREPPAAAATTRWSGRARTTRSTAVRGGCHLRQRGRRHAHGRRRKRHAGGRARRRHARSGRGRRQRERRAR